MRMDRRAITGLPVKLLVISAILALCIPVVSGSLDSGMTEMDRNQMDGEAQRIANAVSGAYYSSVGDQKYLETYIPSGCTLVLGGEGEDSYAIHMYRGSEEIGKHWMEKPMIPFKDTLTIEGRTMLRISADTTGIEVEEA